MRISRFFCLLVLSNFCSLSNYAQRNDNETIPKAPFFCGVAVMADLAGPVMKALNTRFNQLEVGTRLNFRDHYFPLIELGIGECTRQGQETNNKFHTRAPYLRLGMDYNFNKKHNGNRFFCGIRYAFSSFRYDLSNPKFHDPVYPNGPIGLILKDRKAAMQWTEINIGCETKLWSFVRLGWSVRFKARFHQNGNEYGDPYYTPGYGKNNSTAWGGTCNLILDVGRTSKRSKL